MKLFVGVDVGTQGTKAALFDRAGRCVGRAFVPSRLIQPRPGVVEEDPERQFDSVCQAIRSALAASRADAANVAGVGIDGQMAGVVGVGRTGRNVTPYDSWLDTRCAEYIEQMSRSAGDEVLAKTGGPVSFNHGPKILWWMHTRPAVYRRIAAFVQPAGYAVMRLCGLGASDAFIDKTYLHFSGFADNRAGRWDEALCKRFGLDIAKLPRIVDCCAVVGEVTQASAKLCGLKPGTPVVAGCGDTVASFLSAGAVDAGVTVDVAGTASVFAATVSGFRADRKARTLSCGQSATPGLWHAYAYINGGGLNLEWFRKQIVGTSGKGVELARLDREAGRIAPDASLPIFVPHLGGRNNPSQPRLRGAWVGLSWSHSAAHLYRAILEAVALEYAVYQSVVRSLYGANCVRELRVTGGGAKNPLWNQIKADVLGVPVRRIAASEGATLGSAMVAAVGVGAVADLKSAARWVRLARPAQPNRRLAGYYADRVAAYRKLVEQLDGALPVSQG